MRIALLALLVPLLAACGRSSDTASSTHPATVTAPATASGKPAPSYASQHVGDYAEVQLGADLSSFDADQRQMLVKLIEAGQIMDAIFWQQAYGDQDALMANIKDPVTRQLDEYNYGPWDRLNGDHPFVAGIGKKPAGANFYPVDMTSDEFNKAKLPGKDSLYTLLRRDAKGALTVLPYHVAYQEQLARASDLLNQASALSSDTAFKKYLSLRA